MLQQAIDGSDYPTISKMLDEGLDPNAIVKYQGYEVSLIWWAISATWYGEFLKKEECFTKIVEKGSDVNNVVGVRSWLEDCSLLARVIRVRNNGCIYSENLMRMLDIVAVRSTQDILNKALWLSLNYKLSDCVIHLAKHGADVNCIGEDVENSLPRMKPLDLCVTSNLDSPAYEVLAFKGAVLDYNRLLGRSYLIPTYVLAHYDNQDELSRLSEFLHGRTVTLYNMHFEVRKCIEYHNAGQIEKLSSAFDLLMKDGVMIEDKKELDQACRTILSKVFTEGELQIE